MKKLGVIIPAGGDGVRMGDGGATERERAGSASPLTARESGQETTERRKPAAIEISREEARIGSDRAGRSLWREPSRRERTIPPLPKQFMTLGGEPVLARSIRTFRSIAPEAEIVVALPAKHIEEWARLCLRHDVPPHRICEGGATRFASVRNALRELDPNCEYIAVHDAARPLVSAELVLRAVKVTRQHGSAIPVVAVVDTVRRLAEGGSCVGSHPEDRSRLRTVQTPQVFRADILRTAYERAAGEDFTDDATVVESVGYGVVLCEGERRNIKITEPADFIIAESLLEK